eukprot:TRINITY_DN132_c5_g3_i1.p1 TRINITY_DN132_c5_g3~~TRINITY_DN132_c5_g3_i1.p1  ORF type:complete len:534 (+),score=143.62 TRINITY_DN132_c5_g3_i1:70-1602(+)
MSQQDEELIIPFKVRVIKEPGSVTEIRRVRLSNPTISSMLECCKAEGELQLQYEDDEGDLITMSDDAEWKECLTLWKASKEPVLKLTVVCKVSTPATKSTPKKKSKKKNKNKKRTSSEPKSQMLQSILSQASAPEAPPATTELVDFVNGIIHDGTAPPGLHVDELVTQTEIQPPEDLLINIEQELPLPAAPEMLLMSNCSMNSVELSPPEDRVLVPEEELLQTIEESEKPKSKRVLQFAVSAAREITETIYGPAEVEQLLSGSQPDGKLSGFGGWLSVNNNLNQLIISDEKVMVDEVITFASVFEAEKQFDSAIVLISLAMEIDQRNYELWYALARMEALSMKPNAMDTANTAVDLGLAKARIDHDRAFDAYRKNSEAQVQNSCKGRNCFRVLAKGQKQQYCCGRCKQGRGHTRRCVNKTTLFTGREDTDRYSAERAQLYSMGYVDDSRLLEAFNGDVAEVIQALEREPDNYRPQLATLRDMGFCDTIHNKSLLAAYAGDLSLVVMELSK